MGWNDGWTIFEATVIGAYDLGKLDKELLAVLMEPYRDTDIDSGGKQGTLTKDGKEAEQVAIETMGLTMPEQPRVPQPDYGRWASYTEEEREADRLWEEYFEAVDEQFNEITDTFGWH